MSSHGMFSTFLALREGNLAVDFPQEGQVVWSFDIFYGVKMNKLLNK